MQVNVSGEFRRALEEMDVAGARKIWRYVAAHLPQPRNDAEALIMLHHARTAAASVRFNLRAYSHAWLLERNYPSGLPDELRPKAERLYPRIVDAVGLSVSSRYPEIKAGVERAMTDAILEAYADKRTDPEFVKARMMAARERQQKHFADLLKGGRGC